MAAIKTRDELIEYCLRRLGAPVLEINVEENQVEDRIQDAIDFWNEYHFDGVERMYLKAQVEACVLKFDTPVAESFQNAEFITGATSGATAGVFKAVDTYTLKLRATQGVFLDGELVTGKNSGFSANVAAAKAYTAGSWSTGLFPVDDSVTSVIRVFPVGTAGSAHSSTNIFDTVYQFRLNDMYNLLSSDVIYFQQVKMHLQLLDDMFAGNRNIRFNRKQGRIKLDVNCDEVFTDGDYVMFEAYRALDPEQWPKIYNDIFLRRYATALIKRQWGQNMSKFGGLQLPGGVIMNGQQVYDQADAEITKIEEEMISRYSDPVDFFVG